MHRPPTVEAAQWTVSDMSKSANKQKALGKSFPPRIS